MTRSGDELAANTGQPRRKGQNRSRMLVLEAAYEGYRLPHPGPNLAAWGSHGEVGRRENDRVRSAALERCYSW
jgi:hypothetical protein